MNRFLLISYVVAYCIYICDGYRNGDLIRTSVKIYYSNAQSGLIWNEVLGKYCPRYGNKRSLQLPFADKDEFQGDELKMAFSFDRERFITPFFLISNGRDIFLENLEFTFVYSGDDILDLKWKTHYNTEDELKGVTPGIPELIFISYKWEEFAEKDVSFGMGFLLTSGFALSVIMVMYVVFESLHKSTRSPEVKPTRPRPQPIYEVAQVVNSSAPVQIATDIATEAVPQNEDKDIMSNKED